MLTREEIVQSLQCHLIQYPEPLVTGLGLNARCAFQHMGLGPFYALGGMGVAVSLAAGLSLGLKKNVTVLEGDGSILMGLASLTTLKWHHYQVRVIIVDNQRYETTGGQKAASSEVALENVAIGVGLKTFVTTTNEEFKLALHDSQETRPILIVCKTRSNPRNYPRISSLPTEITNEFQIQWMQKGRF